MISGWEWDNILNSFVYKEETGRVEVLMFKQSFIFMYLRCNTNTCAYSRRIMFGYKSLMHKLHILYLKVQTIFKLLL